MSPDGKQFSVTSPDRRIRVFWFRNGKLRRVYDESLEVRLHSIFFSLHVVYTLIFLYHDRSITLILLGGPKSAEE